MVYFFKDEEVVKLHSQITAYMNLNVFGPKKAIINGSLGDWEFTELDDFKKSKKSFDHYWDEGSSTFTLGDFNKLVNFLIVNSGKKDMIEALLK